MVGRGALRTMRINAGALCPRAAFVTPGVGDGRWSARADAVDHAACCVWSALQASSASSSSTGAPARPRVCRARLMSWAVGGPSLSGKRFEGLREAAGVLLHVVLDRVLADHPGRSRGGFRCAIIWRAKLARTTGTCARRLFAVTGPWPRTPSPSCAARPINQIAWFPFCVSFEYPAAFQDNLITWPIKKRRESDGVYTALLAPVVDTQ
jgi:hypothetical protein